MIYDFSDVLWWIFSFRKNEISRTLEKSRWTSFSTDFRAEKRQISFLIIGFILFAWSIVRFYPDCDIASFLILSLEFSLFLKNSVFMMTIFKAHFYEKFISSDEFKIFVWEIIGLSRLSAV